MESFSFEVWKGRSYFENVQLFIDELVSIMISFTKLWKGQS